MGILRLRFSTTVAMSVALSRKRRLSLLVLLLRLAIRQMHLFRRLAVNRIGDDVDLVAFFEPIILQAFVTDAAARADELRVLVDFEGPILAAFERHREAAGFKIHVF